VRAEAFYGENELLFVVPFSFGSGKQKKMNNGVKTSKSGEITEL